MKSITKGTRILSPHHKPVKLYDSEKIFVYPAIACAFSFILILCLACYAAGRGVENHAKLITYTSALAGR